MTPREAHHYSHSRLPLAFPSLTYVGSAGTTLQVTLSLECQIYDFARADGTFLECSSSARRVRSRSSSVPVVLSGGVVPCTGTYPRVRVWLAKPSDKLVRRPTHLSATCFPTSQNTFSGRKTPRQISRARAGAVCGRPSGFSVGTANGRATRPLLSSLKFYTGKRCATSA